MFFLRVGIVFSCVGLMACDALPSAAPEPGEFHMSRLGVESSCAYIDEDDDDEVASFFDDLGPVEVTRTEHGKYLLPVLGTAPGATPRQLQVGYEELDPAVGVIQRKGSDGLYFELEVLLMTAGSWEYSNRHVAEVYDCESTETFRLERATR